MKKILVMVTVITVALIMTSCAASRAQTSFSKDQSASSLLGTNASSSNCDLYLYQVAATDETAGIDSSVLKQDYGITLSALRLWDEPVLSVSIRIAVQKTTKEAGVGIDVVYAGDKSNVIYSIALKGGKAQGTGGMQFFTVSDGTTTLLVNIASMGTAAVVSMNNTSYAGTSGSYVVTNASFQVNPPDSN